MSDKDKSSHKSNSIQTSKGVDAALGDVIRGLLKRPSEEIGDFVADGIGIFSDRVKRKRLQNVELAMDKVRDRLDRDGVDMKDITPPEEEDLHLVINGLSLAGDESVRNLWEGLLANALNPSSETAVERPFVQVLESLSPMDAKIIDLLAHMERLKEKEESQRRAFANVNRSTVSGFEIEQMRVDLTATSREFISSLESKARDYLLDNEMETGWADNLLRQGIVHRPVRETTVARPGRIPAVMNERHQMASIAKLEQDLAKLDRRSSLKANPPRSLYEFPNRANQMEFHLQLTSFGKRLASSCGIL